MPTAHGYAAHAAKAALTPFRFERRDLRPHDVSVEIKYSGICHSDIHQARDEWGGSIFPMVPGHEIAGIVTAVGSAATRFAIGDRVGVGTFVDSCRECRSCKAGLEQYCVPGNSQTYNGMERDGVTPTYGGYSNAIVVDENYVFRMPQNMALDAGAPLLCAGVTVYSPLRQWKAGPGRRVGVIGLGGLGHVAVKIAHAMGADVAVFSHSSRKRDEARRLGAHHFYATGEGDVLTPLAQTFDLLINTVSVAIDWNAYMNVLRVDGSMVVVGLPEHPVPINAMPLCSARRSVAGSGTGSLAETQEMLDFCAQHHIAADIELVKIQQVNEAWERVMKSDVRSRFVIDMSSLDPTR
jgi:uncharacterized zinc-type alcohol dehydrogenase-like protein